MYLFVDPREEMKIKVGIWNGKGRLRFFTYTRNRESLLEFVNKKLSTKYYVLRTIYIVPGPGNFSTVRTAVNLANSLGFALGIPVIAVKPKAGESREKSFRRAISNLANLKISNLVKPIYGKEPNITKPGRG